MAKVLSLKQFLAHIVAGSEQAGYTVEKLAGTRLFIRFGNQSQGLDLKMLFQAYQNAPDRLDDVVNAHLAALAQTAKAAKPITQQEAAESLLPVLQPRTWLEEMQKQHPTPLLQQPFGSGLVITYLFDLPTGRAYVNESMVKELLQVGSISELHVYALKNLRRCLDKYTIEGHGNFEHTLISCESHNGFAAMCVLLPDLLEEWNRRMPGRMLIGIPNRDFVIAFSDRNPSFGSIAQQIIEDARTQEHPLTPRLLIWREGAVREYQPLH